MPEEKKTEILSSPKNTEEENKNEGDKKPVEATPKKDADAPVESEEKASKCQNCCKCSRLFYIFSRKLFLRHSSLLTSFVEVFFSPLMVFGIFAAVTHGISWDKAYQEKEMYSRNLLRFPETEVEDIKQEFRNKYCDAGGRVFLLYYPKTTLTTRILTELVDEFDIENHNTFKNVTDFLCRRSRQEPNCAEQTGLIACTSEEEILEMSLLHRKDRRIHREPVGIVFDYEGWERDHGEQPKIPNLLKYKIRMFNANISNTVELFPYVEPARTTDAVSPYVKSGFLGLQYAIEEAYLEIVDDQIRAELNLTQKSRKSSLLKDPDFQYVAKGEYDPLRIFKMYHYPNFVNETLRDLILSVVCFTIILSYAFFTYFIVKQIVSENEAGVKDLLKLHGVPLYMHWVLLGIHTLILRAISATLITWFLFHDYGNGAILEDSSYVIVFGFIYLHMLSLSSFNYYLTSMFDGGAVLSGVYTVIIGYGTFMIPLVLKSIGLISFYPNLAAAIIFPNWAFYNGMNHIVVLECEDKGVTYNNYFDPPPPGGMHLTLFYSMAILAPSSLLYFFYAVFNDITKQKRISYSYKWYQWSKARRLKMLQKEDHEALLKDREQGIADDDFEKPDVYEEDRERKCIVHVRRITTKGGKHKTILDNISLNVYHGEITILLGHSGSGKSSLIHVMGGMTVPSHGYVVVHGFDVNYDKKEARDCIGYCPQKVILFNLLTVMEHVTLCYRLQGISRTQVNQSAFGLLTLLKLWDVRNRYYIDLNDTSRRKLSIALALVNAPKVILLDEPTHGLDSMARREIWHILVELRNHHTIVIGTNRMDEAEYLGDRLALLSHGKLVCFGTPKYLKNIYDTGYFLKLFPSKSKPFDYDGVSRVFEKHMEEKPRENSGDEILEEDDVILELPKLKTSHYAPLFDELDSNKESLGVDHFSVAQSSLYDVFCKICDAVSVSEAPDKCFRRGERDTRRKAFEGIELPSALQHEEFKPSSRNSACALLHKRLVVMRSKNKLFFVEYILPLFLIFIVCWHAHILFEPFPDPKALEMSLNTFTRAEVFYRLGATNMEMKMKRNYKQKTVEVLESHGVPLLKTEQVLSKFEDPNLNSDGTDREKHFVGVEIRQVDRKVPREYHEKYDQKTFLQYVGYFSSDALHGAPVVMNLVSNAMLNSMYPDLKNQYQLLAYNFPLPDMISRPVHARCTSSCVIFAVLTSFALSLFVAAFIVFPKMEKETGMKHIQLMTGIHPIVYWGMGYLCDFFVAAVFGGCAMAIFVVAIIVSIKPTVVLGIVSLALILSLYLTWSAIPFAYYLSTILPSRVSGYHSYIFLHLLFGWGPLLLMELGGRSDGDKPTLIIFLRNFLNLFPMYTVTAALHRWFEIDWGNSVCAAVPPSVKKICSKMKSKEVQETRENLYDFISDVDIDFSQCCPMVCKANKKNRCFQPPQFFSWEGESVVKPMLIQCVIILFLQGFLYWAIVIFVDKGVVSNYIHSTVLKFIRAHSKIVVKHRQPDIAAEREICEQIIESKTVPENMALVCRDLTKSYATVMVVNDANLAIKKGECIGVLGGGGSGKSTFIKLLCGEVLSTTGEVYIGDSSLHQHREIFLSKIGYCPQNFCLFERFSPNQMISLMGRLRGIPPKDLRSHVDQWLNIFGLYEARHDKCKKLTYGMRRCVCAAMSLIGGAEIILMDEPTSGIDPACRQMLWAVMKLVTGSGRTVIFTTYNTEECSFLSSRMVVMCEGSIQCLGPPLELIKRFSRGFTILIRVRHDVLSPMEIVSATIGRVVRLKKCMKKKFKHLTLRDEQDNLLLYFLRDLTVTWGEIFRRMDQVLEENDVVIEKYYISEATIDEIFILLTNKYREMDAPRKMEPRQPGSITQKEAEKKAFKAMAKKVEKTHLTDMKA